jgi:hypothetical protein
MNELLNEKSLKSWAGCGQRASLERWLRDHGICYFRNRKGEIVSTVAACNSALSKEYSNEQVEFI